MVEFSLAALIIILTLYAPKMGKKRQILPPFPKKYNSAILQRKGVKKYA